jgi:hypothetical protein
VNHFHFENHSTETFTFSSIASNDRVSPTLYFSDSASETGNSTIFEKLLLFKVIFHSTNLTSSTFSFKTQMIIAL